MRRQTQEEADSWFIRNIPSRDRGLISQYYAERERRMEEEAQRREIERKKKAKEDADAVRACQAEETKRKMRRKAR